MINERKIMARIGATLMAAALGGVIVMALTYAGDRSSGPVEEVFKKVGENVTKIENSIVQEVREETRQEKLKWFDVYRRHPERMVKSKHIFWGAYDNEEKDGFDKIIRLEDSLHTKLSIVQMYVAWGSLKSEKFPSDKVKAVFDLGSLPFITWEPWLNDFDKEKFPGIPDPEWRASGSMLAISQGTYDAYIDQWALEAKEFGHPLFIRFGHEMNDPYRYPWGPQNNKPAEYVAAWKHVVDRFNNVGAHNVIWIWSPHPAYTNYGEYWPGEGYVDWVGVPALNYGTVASWSKWWSFQEIFGNYYQWLSMFNKPIMITEFATLSVGGNRMQWYHDAVLSFKKFPLLKSVLFYHSNTDNTTTNKTLNWQIVNDKQVLKALRPYVK